MSEINNKLSSIENFIVKSSQVIQNDDEIGNNF